MLIDYDPAGSAFVARISYEQRTMLREAGWTWSASRKAWVTQDQAKAAVFASFCTPAADKALEGWRFRKLSRLELSMATKLLTDEAIPCPPNLAYDDFQKVGIIYAATSSGNNTLIADPPGLGKTVQAVGIANYFPNIRKVLIVCPGGLTVNWQREWTKWDVKQLRVARPVPIIERTKIEGEKTPGGRQKYKSTTTHVWPSNADVVILSYDALETYEKEVRAIEGGWDLLIVDEAHYIANAQALRTRNVLGGGKQRLKKKIKTDAGDERIKRVDRPAIDPIPAKRRVFLTGTPLLSRPIEAWTMCETCDEKGLGKNWMSFVRRYCDAKQMFGRLDTSGASNLEELQVKMRSTFMVRHDKATVLADLPPKRRQLIELPSEGLAKLVDRELTAAVRVRDALKAFEAAQNGVAAETEEVPWTGLVEALERRFGGMSNLDYGQRALNLTPSEQVAFEELSAMRKDLAAAKVPMVIEHLQNALATGRKVICFVVHKEIAAKLREAFEGCAFITGDVPMNRRQAEVDRFQNDETCRLAIGNITAMGVGYNMTAADWVVFAELAWTPAEVEQAEDRAWRRGQRNAVLVHHLAVEGSVDAKLIEILLQKWEITAKALDAKELGSVNDLSLLSMT